MNLTLEIEDFDQDIFIVNINTPLTFSELVYFINNKKNFNFALDKCGYTLTRKKNHYLWSTAFALPSRRYTGALFLRFYGRMDRGTFSNTVKYNPARTYIIYLVC